MKKFLAILLTAALLCIPTAFAESTANSSNTADAAPWYELNGDDTILTVWLDDARGDDMSWQFEISTPALELLTQEVIGDKPEDKVIDDDSLSPMTYAASFMSFASAENNVSLIFNYNTPDSVEAPIATRVLEMKVSDKNVISILSVLDRRQTFDWLEYDADNHILIVRLPEQSAEGYAWTMSILDPDLLELITCNTETGYIGSFASFAKKAGTTELTLSYGRTDSTVPDIMHTINLSVSENGELLIHWAESFTIMNPADEIAQ